MPNGSPNWAKEFLPGLRKFFRPLAKPIEEFARLYNLRITKYYHQSDGWSLTFRHPNGGVGKIEIDKKGENLRIVGMWWVDDYETDIRSSMHPVFFECEKSVVQMIDLLSRVFRIVISWDPSQLKPGEPDSPGTHREKITRKQFDDDLNRYPIPKIDP